MPAESLSVRLHSCIMRQGINDITATAHPNPRFSWEWISNLGENPVIPDTAFRGKKWPVAVRHCIHESVLDLPPKEGRRTEQDINSARKAMAAILCFRFSIEVNVPLEAER